jgi:hypothetical protein
MIAGLPLCKGDPLGRFFMEGDPGTYRYMPQSAVAANLWEG